MLYFQDPAQYRMGVLERRKSAVFWIKSTRPSPNRGGTGDSLSLVFMTLPQWRNFAKIEVFSPKYPLNVINYLHFVKGIFKNFVQI
jgi:hypothetical protein